MTQSMTQSMTQCIYLSIAVERVIRGMGIAPDNAMFEPAVSYLRVRAVGAPAETLWLVVNGIFRGVSQLVSSLSQLVSATYLLVS